MLSGAMTGVYREQWPLVEPALRWLERLPAPEILADDAQIGKTYRISVPNNDMDVAAIRWLAGKAGEEEKLRTMKEVRPFVLESDGPHIRYVWRPVSIDEATFAGLRYAVHCLHTFGWGVDMAFADMSVDTTFSSSSCMAHWMPSSVGSKLLSIPVEGSLDDQQATYQRFLESSSGQGVDPDTRPSVYSVQTYSDGTPQCELVAFELWTLNGGKPYSKPAEGAMIVAAWLRHAVSQVLLQEGYDPAVVNAAALGHSETEPRGPRFSYLSLPSIGHRHADGRIRRVMITAPADWGADMITLLARKLHGHVLTEEGGREVCRLFIPDTDKISMYTGKGTEWETVTPVVLHGHNALRGQISNRKTERLLFQALESAGVNPANIDQMTFQPAPFWPNTAGARSTGVPAHLKRWPRYHVSITFRKQVTGPVIAGLGRHYGIGTFACRN
jgi:CRISPR-associated protein Csb2